MVDCASTVSFTLRELLVYFLRLGTLGFGGPIALAGHMQKDLVEERRWVSKQDYLEGLAFSQLSPGPLAAQLAMYLGWLRAGTIGATLVGIAFILPSFLMVLVLAALYVHFGSLPWIQGMFYGIGAAVIAIIVRSAIKLVRGTVGRDWLLWAIFTALAITTAWTKSEIVWLFLLCGVIAMFVKAPPLIPSRATSAMFVGGVGPLLTGIHGLASIATVGVLFLFFLKAGAFVFGSGLAIVPFLYGGVVAKFHWLTERQFVDAVAVAMITPGPVVITAAFIGYVVAGPVGALVAAWAVFAPPYFIVLFGAPYYRRFAQNRQVKAFVQGVTAAAVGAIAGAAYILARRSLVDLPTVLIGFVTLVILMFTKKIPEPLVILAAGAVGVFLHGKVG
ncbi:MAG: chromate transporter [Acidobacteria bacterium 13_2_20CM_56_17]|nr:MAG: chromate transporter [Acidobacteria bacterium 13_2_20CM_56_17]